MTEHKHTATHNTDTKAGEKEEVFEGKKVSANHNEVFKKIQDAVKGFDREDNIHKILGVVLLVIGLRWLRARLLGLIMIILGILFLMGYFEKKGK